MSYLSVIFIFCASCLCLGEGTAAPPGSIPVKIRNYAGFPIEVLWIGFDGGLVPQTEKSIKANNEANINSYNTHKFQIRFEDKRGRPSDSIVTFTKGPYEEVITVFNENGAIAMDQVSKYDEFADTVEEAVARCKIFKGDKYTQCVASSLFKAASKERAKTKDITTYRDLMSSRLRNYTCADPKLETSTPIRSETMQVQNKPYQVDVMFEMEAANIWTVPDFITPDECKVLREHGKKHLTRATVAGEDGLGTISEARKANQASYNPRGPEDPLWSLYERVFELTNKRSRYNLDYPGQEGFTIIQYNKDDEYTPHCDGSCDGTKHLPRGRIATCVMYCELPEEGGSTSFTKADVFVKPKPGMATFFTYRGDDGYMDRGFTEHSGCPVTKGEKWITTLWMRDKVDKDHTWSMYDPSGEPDPADRVPRKKKRQEQEEQEEQEVLVN